MTEQNLSIPQVKKLLESLGEENLNQFQRRTLDFASKFAKVEAESAEKLIKKLTEDFDLEEEEAVQIVNCMPQSIEEIKVFLGGGRKIISTSTLEGIDNLLNGYRKSE